ncbi:TrpB-like pyridoxal phosphate-dependent enzyme [Methanobrevibacter sp.]|uniref:TrpB-like pyridoxal phosphate-dependent enzyme n=1 Tax=Methanobrevibacter sp. TaxID=66852 RepID=UPI00388EC5B9
MNYKIILDSDEVPKKWYNILADLPVALPEPKNSEGKNQIGDLEKAFTKGALAQEFASDRYIDIPDEVREIYMQIGRPSPLFRATRLEKFLNTPAKIYYKREDTSPTGSHKLNSAIPQAYFAKKEGVERLTTETGAGQWGTALSLACNMLDLDCTVYMVKVSFNQKPDRKNIMSIYDSQVFASPSENTEIGRQILKENPDHPGSLGVAISEAMEEALNNDGVKYSLGSVLNHVMLHQTIIGQEIKLQLEKAEEEPDIMIACAGGGSNLAGSFFPLLKDKLDGNSETEFIAVEPNACPTLTKGSYEYDFGDINGFTPMLKMFTLGHDFVAPSVHAGGLRYHGMSPIVSLLSKEGYISPRAVHQKDAFDAGIKFARCEGIVPAPETTHAIKATIDEALKCKETGEEKTIVMNFSGHGMLDLKGYASYFEGTLQNAK